MSCRMKVEDRAGERIFSKRTNVLSEIITPMSGFCWEITLTIAVLILNIKANFVLDEKDADMVIFFTQFINISANKRRGKNMGIESGN